MIKINLCSRLSPQRQLKKRVRYGLLVLRNTVTTIGWMGLAISVLLALYSGMLSLWSVVKTVIQRVDFFTLPTFVVVLGCSLLLLIVGDLISMIGTRNDGH
jgi:hypothetical protein